MSNQDACHTLPIPPDDVIFSTIAEMAKWYATERKPRLLHSMDEYSTLLDCITNTKGKNKHRLPDSKDPEVPRYGKGSHQRRLTNEVINKFWDYCKTKDLDPQNFSDFDALVDYVNNGDKPKGFGPTCTYDFCLNYGYKYGLIPDKMVYIHTGPAESIKALKKMGIFKGVVKDDRIPLNSLPAEIQELGALYVEDFLCVLKNA